MHNLPKQKKKGGAGNIVSDVLTKRGGGKNILRRKNSLPVPLPLPQRTILIIMVHPSGCRKWLFTVLHDMLSKTRDPQSTTNQLQSQNQSQPCQTVSGFILPLS